MGIIDDFTEESMATESTLATKKAGSFLDIADLQGLYNKWAAFAAPNHLNETFSECVYALQDVLSPFFIEPQTITSFSQEMCKPESTESAYHAGTFLTCLIDQSYANDFNNFRIDITSLEGSVGMLCSGLKGSRKDPLSVIIEGDTYALSTSQGRYCSFTYSHQPGVLDAHHAENCTFYLPDCKVEGFATSAFDCTFYAPRYSMLAEIARNVRSGTFMLGTKENAQKVDL